MDLILCWLVAPVGLLLVAVGLSLLVERLTRLALPWTVRPAMGLATMIVIAQFGTATEATAKLTLPAILILGVLGLFAGRSIAGPRPERVAVAVAVAVAVFVLFAMPFLVSGEATWAGYIKLDDNATWLAITDHVFQYGRGLGEMAPSTHQQVLVDYLGGAYPIGGFVGMAVMSKVSGQDIAFSLQPSMAVAAAILSLLLFEIARRLLPRIGMAAFVAVVSSLSALLLGYYLWGGVKELMMAALLPLGPILAGHADRAGWPRRSWLPLSLTVVAIVAVLGPGGVLWALPPLVPALLLVLGRRGIGGALRLAALVGVLAFLLALPVIFTPTGPFDPLNGGVTGEAEIGNLITPLSVLQAAGVWPSIDFRTGPHFAIGIEILAVLCLVLAVVAVLLAVRQRRAEGVPLAGYVAGGVVGAAIIMKFGSTWVDGKVLATLSPAMLFAALVGIVMIGERTGFRIEAAAGVAVVAGVVAWGAFLAYQGTWLAPRSHYTELETIGERFAGQGPALSTEVSIFGPRHFLRKLDAEGASDRRRRQVLLTNGSPPEDGQAVDLDSIQSAELDPYNLLVTRRGPAESRAPADFELAYSGDHYDVWKRMVSPGTLVEHLPLGSELDAGDVPVCAEVARLASAAGPDGQLVAARVGTPVAVEFTTSSNPPGWGLPSPYAVAPSGSGRTTASLSVPGGEYEIWLGGVVYGAVDIFVDGTEVASERGVLNNAGGMENLGTVPIAAGEHRLELEYHGAGLRPGSGLWPYGIGPLEFRAPQGSDLGMIRVRPERYRELCGKRWDWIEAYGN